MLIIFLIRIVSSLLNKVTKKRGRKRRNDKYIVHILVNTTLQNILKPQHFHIFTPDVHRIDRT